MRIRLAQEYIEIIPETVADEMYLEKVFPASDKISVCGMVSPYPPTAQFRTLRFYPKQNK